MLRNVLDTNMSPLPPTFFLPQALFKSHLCLSPGLHL